MASASPIGHPLSWEVPAVGAGGSTDPLPVATDAVDDDSDADGDDFDFDSVSDSDYELDFEPPEDDEDAEVISH